ncbi:hypothetical protein [Kribbella sp. VKM Ac-2566]|uniref:hypothetical protein n=1 Tax=Kribbella sp. VKM Ac-2566 TaxID=2512218 RepID=UPI001063B492|nr:hypothetical protein [Kribbella sp. VKM Ac-2566]
MTVTLYVAETFGPATYVAQALATTYRSAGDHRADTDGTAFAETSQTWYYLSGVDVTGAPTGGIVALGDSLTDGTGSTADTDNRFPRSARPAAGGRRQSARSPEPGHRR